jgi:modulator of FtsH protease HflK
VREKRSLPIVFQGLEAGLRMFRWVMLVLLVLFLVSGLQKVDTGSVGLVLRFGRLHGASTAEQVKQPGLVIALPYPIDRLIQVPVKREGEVAVKEVWKDLTELAAQNSIDPIMEGYCLTGDQNIIQAQMVVKYRIMDPVRFQLWMAEPERLLHDVVLAALTQTVSGWKVNDVLRLQRGHEGVPGSNESLADVVRRSAQGRLDRIESGMTISALEFKEMHPPRHVVAEFRDVQNARIEMETQKRDAEGFVAGKLPAAQAESNRLVQEALAYENSHKAKAAAELSVFSQLHAEYKKNPDLLASRILMETMEHMIQKVEKIRFVSPETRVVISPTETKP